MRRPHWVRGSRMELSTSTTVCLNPCLRESYRPHPPAGTSISTSRRLGTGTGKFGSRASDRRGRAARNRSGGLGFRRLGRPATCAIGKPRGDHGTAARRARRPGSLFLNGNLTKWSCSEGMATLWSVRRVGARLVPSRTARDREQCWPAEKRRRWLGSGCEAFAFNDETIVLHIRRAPCRLPSDTEPS